MLVLNYGTSAHHLDDEMTPRAHILAPTALLSLYTSSVRTLVHTDFNWRL